MSRAIPIIFSAPMIRALLEDRKTMTRRLRTQRRKTSPTNEAYDHYYVESHWVRVKPGDRLWVRENFARPSRGSIYYAADPDFHGFKLRPSIHMPRWASRLTLTVTATKIEPLARISDREIFAEGVGDRNFPRTARSTFAALWDSLHGKDAFDLNPEVVALTFTVAKQNIDQLAMKEIG